MRSRNGVPVHVGLTQVRVVSERFGRHYPDQHLDGPHHKVRHIEWLGLQWRRALRAPSTEHVQQPTEREKERYMASMAANDLGPMLTASEVAELLHLHVNTVKRLGDRGELPFYRVCKRGDRRFRLEDVMAFLARNR